MRLVRRQFLGATGAALLSAAGGVSSAQASGYREISNIERPGRLRGTVKFSGPRPDPEQVRIIKDNAVCGEGIRTVEGFWLGEENGLGEVVLEIRGIAEGKPWGNVYKEAKIYQIDCGFQPQVQIVSRDADVYVINFDPILHNVSGYEVFEGTRRSLFSFSQPRMGQEDRIPLKLRRGNLIELDCNAHGWMNGWVYTAPTPYMDVTGTDGEFEIDNIPPGDYELSIWHPLLGTKTAVLNVGPNADLNFNLALNNDAEGA